MPSVSTKPLCKATNGPRCDHLLSDPESVLANQKQWPKHICPEIAYASTRTWARAHASRMFEGQLPPEVRAWTNQYPLPVGRWSIPDGVPEFLAVLSLWCKAAIILEPDIPLAHVAAFGIVNTTIPAALNWGDDMSMLPVPMQFTGVGCGIDRVETFRYNADRWWKWYAGDLVGSGRPTGPVHSREDYVKKFRHVSQKLGRPPRSLAEFTREAGLSPDTVKRNLKQLGTGWSAFKQEQISS